MNKTLIGNPSKHPKWPFVIRPLEKRAKQVWKIKQIPIGRGWRIVLISTIIRFVLINDMNREVVNKRQERGKSPKGVIITTFG